MDDRGRAGRGGGGLGRCGRSRCSGDLPAAAQAALGTTGRRLRPVWSALYVGIGAAGWRLSRTASPVTKGLHLTQLALNAAWPVVFFRVRDKRASLAVVALLDAAVTAEVLRLRREDPGAAVLLLPYLAWSGFATALNAAVSDPSDTE